ncbi:MAG: hypothetical protein WCE88_00080, partial [Burkholderiales bacterium]
QQERAYVDSFLVWFNRKQRSDFKVVTEPNPPEAIIKSGRTTRWIEVGAVYWTSEYARDLHSYATPGETHQPVDNGPFQNMDAQFAHNFVTVLKKKLENRSYIECLRKHGPGYLVMPVYHPWFDKQTIQQMKYAWAQARCDDLGCFRSVFIAYPVINEVKFSRWSI